MDNVRFLPARRHFIDDHKLSEYVNYTIVSSRTREGHGSIDDEIARGLFWGLIPFVGRDSANDLE